MARASIDALAIDRGALDRVARAATASACVGFALGLALALRRRRPAAVAPTHAVAGAMNAGALGTGYAMTLEALERAPEARDARTHAVAGAIAGAAVGAARAGRGASAAGGVAGATTAFGARACATAIEGARDDEFEFPTWFPVQRARGGRGEGETLARMAAARRGELSASEEAETRDEYSRMKMRRARER